MEKIVSIAGFMLTKAIDNLDLNKFLAPMYIGYNNAKKEIKKELKGLPLEESIPKVISMFEENRQNVDSSAILFPAEVGNIDISDRESIIIVMAQDYIANEYITISLPYTFNNNKIKVSKYELIDFSPFIIDKLPRLEKSFVDGLLSYGDANLIWNR